MRRKTPDLDSAAVPAARVATPRVAKTYPLETVAGVAVHLLRNRDHATAAKEAVDLLDACRKELATRAWRATAPAKARAHVQAKDARVKRGPDGRPYRMKWRELYEYVTGETREERAMPKLKKTLEHLGWKNITAKIDRLKKEGLQSTSVLDLRDACEKFGLQRKSRVEKKSA